MNELLLAEFLKPKVSVVHNYSTNGQVWGYYALNILDEFSKETIIPEYCEAYLVLICDKYKFYDRYKYSFDLISKEYAHNLKISQELENFVDFEIWLKDRFNQSIYYKYNKFSKETKSMLNTLIEEFKEYENTTNEFVMTPKTCFSKYKTLEYMQYKYVNDREIKEWVGSSVIIDNGLHSPKKIVKAGHIVDKNRVVHQLYMNDYILRTTEENVFVIISEDIFHRLFEHYEDNESYELIHNKDDEGCLM